MLTTTLTPAAVDAAVKKHFVDGYKQVAPKLDMVFKVTTQENLNDEYRNYAGVEDYTVVNEGTTFPSTDPLQSYNTILTPVKYGRLFEVTYEMRKWDKTRDLVNGAQLLGKAAARKIEKEAAAVFNNAFNTAFTSYGDGRPLCSTQHPRADGLGIISNASASSIALTEANLEAAILALEEQLDDRGNIIDITATTILVPPALRKEALVIVNSDYKPGTDYNDVNVYAGMQEYYGTLNVIVWKYLGAAAGGSDTAWFLLDKNQHKVTWQWAEKPRVERDASVGFKEHVLTYRGFFYASKGWTDFRGVWGSKGDGSTYSD